MKEILCRGTLVMTGISKFGESLSTASGRFQVASVYSAIRGYLRCRFRDVRNRAQIRRRLAKAWVRSRVHRIQTTEACRLIESRQLRTVNGSWHFSWHIDRFFDEMFLYEDSNHSYVFHTEPISQWAPAPLFTDDPRINLLIAEVGKNCSFWLLKLSTFDEFLARRSDLASQPTAHFPTRQTYPRYARRIACSLERLPLTGNEELFCKHYNQWKLVKYGHSGEDILDQYFSSHRRVPNEWLFIHALRHNASGACKGVCLVIEDGRSCSVFNIASERGHGRFMLVESIKECCRMGYSTYDCGVSATYGDYKSGVYLDRIETEDTGVPSFLPGSGFFSWIRKSRLAVEMRKMSALRVPASLRQ